MLMSMYYVSFQVYILTSDEKLIHDSFFKKNVVKKLFLKLVF